MKIRMVYGISAAALALGALAPAFAQTTSEPAYSDTAPYSGERIDVPGVRPSGAIHGGWVAPEDEKLLGDAVTAFSSDRLTNGATVTMVAKNGELIMNGTATDVAQAARMERLAKQIAGGRVTAWFDQPGA